MACAPTASRLLTASSATTVPGLAHTLPLPGQVGCPSHTLASEPSTPRIGSASRNRSASDVPCQ